MRTEWSRLLVLMAGAVALILVWGAAEKGPTRWDDSWYLAAAVRLYDRFAEEGLPGYWRGFEHALGDKAPLITLLPFPFFLLIGRSVFVIYLVNSVVCAVLAVALYWFCRHFFGPRASFLAAFFALSSPLLGGLSRLFLPEYSLTALVVASCWSLARWAESGRSRWLLVTGVLWGLGLLMKITFPLFAGPVAAAVLLRARGRRIGRLLLDAAWIALPALLLAGSWYSHNWESVTRRSFQESYFAPVHPTDRPSPARMGAEYLLLLLNHGVSSIQVLAAVAGLAAWAATRRGNFLGGAWIYVAPWAASLPVFALSENRDLRLIAPVLPALAVAAAALFERVLALRPGASRILVGTVVGAGTLLLAGSSFPRSAAATVRLGPWQLVPTTTEYSFPPNPQRWPLTEVLERLARRERLGPGSQLIVGLGADAWSFNSNNLDLRAALLKYPFEFHTTAYTASTDEIRRIMSRTQYFLLKDGGTQQPPDRFRSGARATEFLLRGPLFREVPPPIAAPDGGQIRIFENTALAGADVFSPAPQSPGLPALDPVDLNFGNYLAVTGLRLTEQEGLFTLAIRWRCLNPPPRSYRAFAHLVDSRGKLLGSMDHEILHGSPPVTTWLPDEEGYEARHLALPAAQTRDVELRLGLFDPDTGLRLPLWASTLPLRDDYTAAVVKPNQTPAAEHLLQMRPAALLECRVEFEGGYQLTGYSLQRASGVAWLRLRWRVPWGARRRIFFFGHAVADQSPDTRILLSFDQDLGVERLSRRRWFETEQIELIQDVVRDVSRLGPEAQFLRVGLFDMDRPNDRLAIESSSLPSNPTQKAVFLRYP